jgi:hypothetical protein
VQAGRAALQRVARFMNKEARQMRFYAAVAIFRRERRLTGFQLARRIVRIRTICPVAETGYDRMPPEIRLVHE